MRNILILNRRCIKHPEKGGAEVYTFEIAKGFRDSGFNVEWFSSKAKNLTSEEVIDGIKFIRKGDEFTTHFYGFLYALNKKEDYLIIDEFNGVGFFTFFKKNSIVLIHQLYEEFWNVELGKVGYIFRFLEKIILKFYKNKKTVTVSQSTKEDLEKLGFKNITIIPNGLEDYVLDETPEKNKNLTLIYVGRMKKTKNPESAIKIFLHVLKQVENSKLIMVGTGPLLEYLKEKYKNIKNIEFLGYLNEDEKKEYLKKSHFILVPSIREGWGQVVIQANAFGTPAVGFKVKGLIDSIKDKETGFLVNNEEEACDVIIKSFKDKDFYKNLSQKCINWAKNFSWEKTKKEFVSYANENFNSTTNL